MKKKLLLILCIVFVSALIAEINDVNLVVSAGEDEMLLYDHDAGIFQQGDNIYLAYYLRSNDDYNMYFNLKISISTDNGIEFIEHDLQESIISSAYQAWNTYGKLTPSIWVDETSMIFVFFLDPVTATAMVATSNDLGETFSFQPISGMPDRSQFKVLKTDSGLLIGAMETAKIPMSRFQYLTQYEESENFGSYDPADCRGDVLFWGPEYYEGLTMSEDDIWIRQGGGGNNNGWPTFDQIVLTSGRIMDYATGQPAIYTAPMDDIFLGGYIENSVHFSFPAVAENIRANGITIEESADHDVLFAEIEGNIAHLRYADWLTQIEIFTVYNSFPDLERPDLAIGDSIWVNEVTTRELVWEEETTDLEVNDTSVFVNCQLWIEGSIGSDMTWGCADTVYITSDIFYADIEMGDPAEDSEYLFGLVSEERIYYKYKYKDYAGNIHDDNCNGIYLYGSYAALGDGDIDLYGDMNTHYEGIITPEYQHPHGSTPAFTIDLPQGDWDVQYPDLHKFIFPPDPLWTGDQGFQFHGNEPVPNNGFYTCGYPYEVPGYGNFVTTPYGADYPWYNPVYPEAACPDMGERGILHHFGGKQQRRYGYIHRSGTDPNNHSGYEWDIQHWQYSGTHGTVGYEEDYHWDSRLENDAPPDYPEIDVMLGYFPGTIDFSLYSFDSAALSVEQIDSFETDIDTHYNMIDFCLAGNDIAFLIETDYYYYNFQIVTLRDDEWSIIELEDITPGNSMEIWNENYIVKGDDGIFVLDTQGNQMILPDLNQFSSISDYQSGYDGILFSINGEEPLWSLEVRQAGDLPGLGYYDFGFTEGSLPYNSSMEIALPHAEHLLMQIVEEYDSIWRYATEYIYLATGDVSDILTGTIDDEIVVSPQFNCYPNPFNPEVNLSFNLDHSGLVEITIYNIKGQIVDQVINKTYSAGEYTCTWKAPAGSSGIYLAQYKLNNELISCRKLTLLK